MVVELRALHRQITVELLISDAPPGLAAHSIDLALRATEHELPDMAYRASTCVDVVIAGYASPACLEASSSAS